MQKFLLTGTGGFFGAIARLWVDTYVSSRLGTRFPFGTFVINMSGCFAIGVMLTILNHRLNINPGWRYFLPIGFVGAYTTFSSFEFETLSYYQGGGWFIPVLYVTMSILIGLVCVWADTMVGKLAA